MELLERYLQAVRTYLPKGQQDDILRELRENLRSQVEDQEGELGRSMSERELGAILKQHGHPIVVATRYRQARYLIRPSLFPVYWFVLKICLTLAAFGQAVAALVMLAQNNPVSQVVGALFNAVSVVLPVFGWVTLVFAVLDLSDSRLHLLEKIISECNLKFEPQSLPPLRESDDTRFGAPISRTMTLFELFFSIAFALWWIRVIPFQKLIFFMALGPAGLTDKIPFQLGPIWRILFVPVFLLSLAAIAQQVYNWIDPYALTFFAVSRIILHTASFFLLLAVIRAGDLLVLIPGTVSAGQFTEPLRLVNLVLHYTFIFVAAGAVFECFKMIRRLVRF
jgi:hypothetical protein